MVTNIDVTTDAAKTYQEKVEKSQTSQLSKLSEMCDAKSFEMLCALITPMLDLDPKGSAKSSMAQADQIVFKGATSEGQASVRLFPASPPEKLQSEKSPEKLQSEKPRTQARMGGA